MSILLTKMVSFEQLQVLNMLNTLTTYICFLNEYIKLLLH